MKSSFDTSNLERKVGELHQHHQEMFLAYSDRRLGTGRRRHLPHRFAADSGSLRRHFHRSTLHHAVETVLVHTNHLAGLVGGPVAPFVAMTLNQDGAAVRLGIAEETGLCGLCQQTKATGKKN